MPTLGNDTMKLEEVEMGHFEDSFDSLPLLDVNCDELSSLSSPIDCPSLSESFLSSNGSVIEANGKRRSSLASSTTALFSATSTGFTSPATPITITPSAILNRRQSSKHEQDFNCAPTYDFSRNDIGEENLWIASADNVAITQHLASLGPLSLTGAFDISDHSLYGFEYRPYVHGVSNPPLSRSIFCGPGQSDATVFADEEMMAWPTSLSSTPPQTIAPTAAFQPILINSPLSRHEPFTPLRRDVQSCGILSSSPLSTISPPVLPSQHDVDGFSYEAVDHFALSVELRRHRSTTDRFERRGYGRKQRCGYLTKPKQMPTKSGIDCELVIAQNEFACGYPGCIDKQTGKQKRFKRQEHKKRHEKTVHEKSRHGVHKCWVPLCKTEAFTRTDNLKSHLKNTHGKRSANQRNRYVATQDKNSEYYDPEWVGDLTAEGFPVR